MSPSCKTHKRKNFSATLVLLCIMSLICTHAYAGIFDDIKKVGKDVGDGIVGVGEDVVDTGKKAAKTVEKTGKDVGNTVVKTGKTVGKGVTKAGKTVEKTAKVVGKEIVHTGEKALDAGIAFGEDVMIAMGTNAIVPRTNGFSTDKRKRLRLQHTLDYDVPLTAATWIGTHNSYNNRDAQYPLPNQNADMIEQLDNGFRVLSYDIYADKASSGTPIRLCHKLCSGEEDTLEHALKNLSHWLDTNPNEVVMIIAEYKLSGSEANKAATIIRKQLEQHIYGPANHKKNNNGACQKLPINTLTKRDVLNAGKQVIFTGYEGCGNKGAWRNYVWELDNQGFMADAGLKEKDLRSDKLLNIIAEDRSVYGADLFCADFLNVKAVHDIAGLAGKVGIKGAKSSDVQKAFNKCKDKLELTVSEIRQALEKGVPIIGLDYGVDIDRAEGAIWSWEKNEPNGGKKENCAALVKVHGQRRWYDMSCDEQAQVACRHSGTHEWQTTKEKATFSTAEALCQKIGPNYHFAAPVNGRENYLLSQKATQQVTLIKATDTKKEGEWLLNSEISWTKAKSAKTKTQTKANIEVQTLKKFVTHKETAINLKSPISNPAVFVSAPSYHGSNAGVFQITKGLNNKSAKKFFVKFNEWDYLDGSHTKEDIDILALSKGNFLMSDKSTWQIGSFKLAKTGKFKYIRFPKIFKQKPYLFLTIQNETGTQTVSVRADKVSQKGFKAALFEQESLMNGHNPVVVSYLAIDSKATKKASRIKIGGKKYTYQLFSSKLNQNWKKIGRYQYKLEEEQSKDKEVAHKEEIVNLLEINGAAFIQQVSNNEVDTTALRRK